MMPIPFFERLRFVAYVSPSIQKGSIWSPGTDRKTGACSNVWWGSCMLLATGEFIKTALKTETLIN